MSNQTMVQVRFSYGHAGEIDRDKLKNLLKHEGSTAFGVICNQLARGGGSLEIGNGQPADPPQEREAHA